MRRVLKYRPGRYQFLLVLYYIIILNSLEFHELIKKDAKAAFSVKLLNNSVYKIIIQNCDDYRAITKAFNSTNVAWYSYENKNDRPIKVIVKGLHHSWEPYKIIADLKKQKLKNHISNYKAETSNKGSVRYIYFCYPLMPQKM